jgi:hypothetical protein
METHQDTSKVKEKQHVETKKEERDEMRKRKERKT